MNLRKKLYPALCITLAVMFFQIAEAKKTDAEKNEINSACAEDGQKAGCGDKKFGTGLLKCIRQYKKDHKDFKLSEACKTARKNSRH